MIKKDFCISGIKRYFHLILLILIPILLFAHVLFPPANQVLFGGDVNDAYYYWKNYLRENIRSGTIPFWNPYNFSGTPFLAHPTINIFYPPNWFFILLPLNYSFSFYFLFHIILAGLTMYWLSRKFTGISGAFTAAIVYALGGYFAGRIFAGHMEYVDAAAFVPLVFGSFLSVIQVLSRKNLLKAILSLTLLIYAGNELFLLFTIELVFLYFVYYFVINIKRLSVKLSFKQIAAITLCIIFAFGLSAVEFLPRYQFISLSLRSQRLPYSVAGSGALPFEGLWLFLNPNFWGSIFPEYYTYNGPWPGLILFNHYIGVFPIIMLVFFLIFTILKINNLYKIQFQESRDKIWFFLLIVIPIALVISFGSYIKPNIHELLWSLTPFYKGIRLPARHLFLVFFSLSLVTGLILDRIKYLKLKILLIFFITLNLFLYDRPYLRLSPQPLSIADNKLISLFSRDKSLFRVMPDYSVVSPVRKNLDFGAYSNLHIQSSSDYNSMVLWRYYHFIDILNKSRDSSIARYNVEIPPPNPNSAYIDFLNVKYIITDNNLVQYGYTIPSNLKLLATDPKYKIFENQSVSQRFILVNQPEYYNSDKEVENALIVGRDLKKKVLFKEIDALNLKSYDFNCSNLDGSVDIISYKQSNIILKVKASCNSLLSTSEVYYPQWRAKIDGLSTKIILSNYSFRTIYIPKGEHLVEFYYSPSDYIQSLGITGFTGLLLIFIYKYKRNTKLF